MTAADGGVIGLYPGGMRARVWTDVPQMAALLVGIVVCGALAWQAAGASSPRGP